MSTPAVAAIAAPLEASAARPRRRPAWWASPWAAVLAFLLAGVFLGPFFYHASAITQLPDGLSYYGAPLPPSARHWLGTDDLGRDVLARLLVGGRWSLVIAGGSTLLTGVIGVGLGLLSGFAGGRVDNAVMRLTEIVMAFPGLLLAIALASVLPPGPASVVLTLTLVGWTNLARLVRGRVLALREQEFIDAAYAVGASRTRVLFTHIWPNVRALASTLLALKLSDMLLLEAALGFLGLGIAPPTPTWGGLVSEGKNYFYHAPWLGLPAGVLIFATVLAVNLLAERWGERDQ